LYDFYKDKWEDPNELKIKNNIIELELSKV